MEPYRRTCLDMPGPGTLEPIMWQPQQLPRPMITDLEHNVDDDDDDTDEDEDDEDEDSNDEHNDCRPLSRVQSVARERVTNLLARIMQENSRSESGADAVAAFWWYSLQNEINETRMIESSDLQIPAEHLARLLDPISNDARVRAYFREVSEEIDKEAIVPGRLHDYAQMSAQRIFGIMQNEAVRNMPGREHPARELQALAIPDLRYALAKALLASNRVKDATSQLQMALTLAKMQQNHVVSQACQRLLVNAWRKSNESGRAVALLEAMIEQQRVQLGAKHPSILTLQHALAAAYEEDQKGRKAVTLLKQMMYDQNKLQGHQYQSQLITLHLLLRSQTSTGQKAEANTTISRIVEVIKRSDVPVSPLPAVSNSTGRSKPSAQHPLNHYSRPQTLQLDHAVSNVSDSKCDISSSQQIIDHGIDSQPPNACVPLEIQAGMTAYAKLEQVPFWVHSSTVDNAPMCLPHERTLENVQSVSVTSAATTATSMPLRLSATTGTACTSQPFVIIAAVIAFLGTIIAWLLKICLVDRPQLMLLRQTERREQRKTDAELHLWRQTMRREELAAEINQQRERLNIINGLASKEEQLVRKDVDSVERKNQIEQIREKLKHQLSELRKQIDVKEKEKEVEYHDSVQQTKQSTKHESEQAVKIKRLEWQLQQSKRSEELQSQDTKHVEILEQQLSACRAKLSKAGKFRERHACITCQKSGCGRIEDLQRAKEHQSEDSGELEDDRSVPVPVDNPGSAEDDGDHEVAGPAYEMNILKSAGVKSDLELDLHSAVEAGVAFEESSDLLQGKLDAAEAKIKTQQSELDILGLQLIATQCEYEQSEITLAARRGGSPKIEACLSCAESRSAIRALREDLSGEDFDGKEVEFLNNLDSACDVNELVPVLCGRLKSFVQTLYQDLLPLHEKETRDLQAKLGDADTIIADYQDRLANSLCKQSRLEHQLRNARSELNKALAKVKEPDTTPAQQTPSPQATSWVEFRWPFNWETQKR